jgi:DNA-binding HxlR family transcriptional regulator
MDTKQTEDTTEIALCPVVEEAFEILGRKWVGLIVHVLARGELHFCELERAIPSVSARMLTLRVKDLETQKIVLRTVHSGTPVHVTYRLTEKGQDLVPVLAAFADWARRWDRAAGNT